MSFKVGNKIISLKQLPPDEIGVLRKSRASEMSTFVKCNNHSHTISLKKKVDMWYKEQNINLTKLSRGQQGMYRSLIQVSNVKRRVRREMYIKRHQEVQEKLREKATIDRLKTQNPELVSPLKKLKKRVARPKVATALIPTLEAIEETERSSDALENIKEEWEEDGRVEYEYRMNLESLRKNLLERESSGFLETPSAVSRTRKTENPEKLLAGQLSIRMELENPYGEPLPAINKDSEDGEKKEKSDSNLITMVTEANKSVGQDLISPDISFSPQRSQTKRPEIPFSKTPLPKIGQQLNASPEENKRAGDKPIDITKFHFHYRGNRIPKNVHIKQVNRVVRYRKNSRGSLQPSEFSVKPVEEDFRLPSKRERYNVHRALREEKEKSLNRQNKLDNFYTRMEALKLEMEAARTATRQSAGTPKESFEKKQPTLGFHTTVYTQAQKLLTVGDMARTRDESGYLRRYRRQSEDEDIPDFPGRLAGRRVSSWDLPTLDKGSYLQ